MQFIDEIAPVMPERPWTQDAPAETQPHSSLPVSADEEYADAHEIFDSGHAQFDAALTGSLNYLLTAAPREQSELARLLSLTAKTTAISHLVERRPFADPKHLRHALIVAGHAAREADRIGLRFALEGRGVTMHEIQDSSDWMATAAHAIDDAMSNAFPASEKHLRQAEELLGFNSTIDVAE